jgi:beta-xylosidase
MKRTSFFAILFLTVLFFSCGSDSPTPSTPNNADLIVTGDWRLNRVLDTQNQVVQTTRLSLATKILFDLDFQFRSGGIVRAFDKVSKQVINSGTWKFADNEKNVDVDVVGFKGKFELVSLSSTQMVLGQKMPIDGKENQDGRLEFSIVR